MGPFPSDFAECSDIDGRSPRSYIEMPPAPRSILGTTTWFTLQKKGMLHVTVLELHKELNKTLWLAQPWIILCTNCVASRIWRIWRRHCAHCGHSCCSWWSGCWARDASAAGSDAKPHRHCRSTFLRHHRRTRSLYEQGNKKGMRKTKSTYNIQWVQHTLSLQRQRWISAIFQKAVFAGIGTRTPHKKWFHANFLPSQSNTSLHAKKPRHNRFYASTFKELTWQRISEYR